MEKYAKLFETAVRKTPRMIKEGSLNNMQEILDHYLGHFTGYIKLFIFSSEKNELSSEGREFNSYLDDKGESVYKTIYPTFYNLVKSYEKGIDKKTILYMYPPKELTTKLNDKIMKLYINDSPLNKKEKKLLEIVRDAIRKKISSIKKPSSYYSAPKSSSYFSPTKSSERTPNSSSYFSPTKSSERTPNSSSYFSPTKSSERTPNSSSYFSPTKSSKYYSPPKSFHSTKNSSSPFSGTSPAMRLSSLSRVLPSSSSRKSITSPAMRLSSLSSLLSTRATRKSSRSATKSSRSATKSSDVISLKNRKRCKNGYRKHPSIPGKCKKKK